MVVVVVMIVMIVVILVIVEIVVIFVLSPFHATFLVLNILKQPEKVWYRWYHYHNE